MQVSNPGYVVYTIYGSSSLQCHCSLAQFFMSMLKCMTHIGVGFQLVVQKKRQEFAHACTFGGNFELKITCMLESCWTTNWKIPVERTHSIATTLIITSPGHCRLKHPLTDAEMSPNVLCEVEFMCQLNPTWYLEL